MENDCTDLKPGFNLAFISFIIYIKNAELKQMNFIIIIIIVLQSDGTVSYLLWYKSSVFYSKIYWNGFYCLVQKKDSMILGYANRVTIIVLYAE